MASALNTQCVEDVDNQFSDWMDAHPGPLLVVRPDRFIAAQCSAADLPEVTRRFAAFTTQPQPEQRLAA